MYSLWLLFDKQDSKYLEDIIEALAKKYNAPKFLPHLTIYDSVDVPLSVVEQTVRSGINGMSPFIVKKSNLDHSDYIWKTVFIEIEKDFELVKINEIISKSLSRYANYEFKPHISLIYKNLDKSEREKIIAEIFTRENFMVDKLAIVRDSDNVMDWEIIESFVL